MKYFPELGFQVPDILLPNSTIEKEKWAVIACDQYTSQPDYWENVKNIVGESPSTFHMILPEIYLNTPEEARRISSTQQKMREYQSQNVLVQDSHLVMVERTSSGKTRHGLMLALDLEKYDFSKGSHSLIRATEGTIIDRLPPRIRIREGASLEIPHILVLIDDPQLSVIEPITAMKDLFEKAYDLDLMLGSGHLNGYFVTDESVVQNAINALRKLTEPALFQKKYGVGKDAGILLFAVGDGNHSLATAKSIWERIKTTVPRDHPARYALVEVENIHDSGLEFEPIHRVMFHTKVDILDSLHSFFGSDISIDSHKSTEQIIQEVDGQKPDIQKIGLVTSKGNYTINIIHPKSQLAVGTIQLFLDACVKSGSAESIDYVHGKDIVFSLGTVENNLGLYLPSMGKGDLFKTVIKDGVLPRKTFSMGEAQDKRFYMECRLITT
jgi:hypothetical protein